MDDIEDENYNNNIDDIKKRNSKEIAEFNRKVTCEKKKLEEIFSDSAKDIKKITETLIENASYMKIELENLKKFNIKNGIKELYMNGKGQFGYKESVESKTYNTMIKNYISIIKQLNELLPKDKKIDPDDDFDKFGEE